jgi:hypothetical protein
MTSEPPGVARGVRRGRIVRGWWFVIGMLCVGVGGIGVIVPGLPTTGFMILAAWCFARSSPRFEQWVLNLPGVGQAIRDHRAGLGMPRRAKVSAIAMMAAAVAISAVVLRERPVAAGTVIIAGLVGSWYVIRRVPTKELVLSAGSGARSPGEPNGLHGRETQRSARGAPSRDRPADRPPVPSRRGRHR